MKKLLSELKELQVGRRNVISADAIAEAEAFFADWEAAMGKQKHEFIERFNALEERVNQLQVASNSKDV